MTFEEFVERRLAAMLKFAAVMTGDQATAEDVVQEVLIRAQRHWDKIGALDRPELYLRRMIVNEFASVRRRLWRLVPSGRVSDFDDGVVPDHADGHADRDALVAEIASLPRRQRAVIVLRYYEGLTDGEIAKVLGCAPGTIRGYASRALATLRVGIDQPPAKATFPQQERA